KPRQASCEPCCRESCRSLATSTPEWGPWVISQLQQRKCIQPLPGFGYSGVAIKTKRKELLALLRRGLRNHQLAFPPSNGAVEWPEISSRKQPDETGQRHLKFPPTPDPF